MIQTEASALDRARRKAYRRLLPLLFLCYVIAYIDRTNVSIAFPYMEKGLSNFGKDVQGFGGGIFFIGYFLLEIPGTLLVEKWSARKWISRIMVSWGIVAALTSMVSTPIQFYIARFVLGLAEAGFFPGVIVYLTHWFPSRDRTKALAWFLIGTPVAQALSPFVSIPIVELGVSMMGGEISEIGQVAGFTGWQWMYIVWGVPAVILGILVLIFLTDRPRNARWLTPEESEALESELERERLEKKAASGHMSWGQALKHPKVLVLAGAYFFIVTGNYGIEIFLPTILREWYQIKAADLRYILMIPAAGSLFGQLFIGWSSDRTKERRLHAAIPIYLGATALMLTVLGKPHLAVMMLLFTIATMGLKAYLPAFWALPSLFLTEAAAAGSIGLINSVGNLGGFVGPFALGKVYELSNKSFVPGILFLCVSMSISATIIMTLQLGRREAKSEPSLGSPPSRAD
ncbi:MAG: MFS transporter [Isosphaeraceae bacterium]|nr:MFS transporter [Isosphaeraceae bacterium]